MNLRPHDIVDYQGIAFTVTGVVDFQLAERALRLARLASPDQTMFLELPGNAVGDRVLMLAEIPLLDLTTPPPAAIYHGGESYLLHFSGSAEVAISGEVPGAGPGPCLLWRYRAAGDRYLQIESWPSGVRMLEGATAHRSMIEVRPTIP